MTIINSESTSQPLNLALESGKDVPVPILWLLGKTGSGKTSIVRYLTGADDAEIGNGFQPKTKFSSLYCFPDDEVPIAKFLDTRGLGEVDYDATKDIEAASLNAHLVIAVIAVGDQANATLLETLKQIRRQSPSRPILLCLTKLHELYPGEQPAFAAELVNQRPLPENLPSDLRKAIEAQQSRFAQLVDRVVSVDLTKAEEGFDEPDFGGRQLQQAILEMLPEAFRQSLIQLEELNDAFKLAQRQRCAPIILAHSFYAASAAAVPVPWIDIPLVLAIQTRLAHRLAKLNNQTLDAATLARVSAAVGGRVALRMGLREALKFIPWFGIAANAAATFAFTYASGWAWNWYFVQVKQGHVPTADELKEVFRDQLNRGEKFWKTTKEKQSA